MFSVLARREGGSNKGVYAGKGHATSVYVDIEMLELT
jgi:hypothetical protein